MPLRRPSRVSVSVLAAVLLLLGASRLRADDATPKADKIRDDAWRASIRKALYVPDPLPPIDAHTWSSFSPAPGVRADRITYTTADGMRVPAIVYLPEKHKGRIPAIVVVNGHGSDKFGWYAFYSGILYARAGAVVLTYDPIGEGERNIDRKSRAGSHDKIVDTPHWGQRLSGLMITDLEQAVAYLAQHPDVDSKRIGVVGYSLGSFVAGITAAIDPQIHALILSGGGDFDGPGGYFDSSKLPCQGPPYRSLSVLGDRPAVLYALNADRGPTLIMNGLADTVVDIPHHGPDFFEALRQSTIKLHGSDQNVFETIFFPGVSHRTSWVTREGTLWLDKQLHFPNWTEAEIQKMPTTHISEWAIANNVDITKNYISEDREGGLNALGLGFPGIPRADLMVLTEEQWKLQKDQLTYEAWAAKALAAEQAK